MIIPKENESRLLIPNWRSFYHTVKLGELNGSKGLEFDSSFKPDLSDLFDAWEDNKTIGVAGDIIGAAVVSNQQDDPLIKYAAQFILENIAHAPKAMINAANDILNPKSPQTDYLIDFASFQGENNLHVLNPQKLFLGINRIKKNLIKNPKNAISWIELGRLYSIVGQEQKAKRAILNALFLSDENRFVLRSVARFFTHIGDIDFAHDVIRKKSLTQHDPWLMATEIALATKRERMSTFVKKGINLIQQNDFHPFNITELASSIATVELLNANRKKSKHLFEKSVIDPNDNSLAQFEWINKKEQLIPSMLTEKLSVRNSFEALAITSAKSRKWEDALLSASKWFIDLPFSKRAIIFGNNIAMRRIKDHNRAIEIAKVGLLSHPRDTELLNNIIYSLCILNRTEEAKEFLQEIKKEDLNSRTQAGICITATIGLYHFRTKNAENGRKFYLQAIQMAKDEKMYDLQSSAIINYLREEIAEGKDVTDLIPNLHQIKEYFKGDLLADEAEEVLQSFQKMQSGKS